MEVCCRTCGCLSLKIKLIAVETLAMKGLVTFQSGKKEEGLELIRKGIRNDMTSHIVWHVFGLAKKQDKDYEEASKSYQQALRFEKVRHLL